MLNIEYVTRELSSKDTFSIEEWFIVACCIGVLFNRVLLYEVLFVIDVLFVEVSSIEVLFNKIRMV